MSTIEQPEVDRSDRERAQPDHRIKILFCIDRLVRGGTELQLMGLIDRLDRRYYQPCLLTLRPTDPALVPADCVYLGWRVPRLASLSGLSALRALKNWMRREQVAVVQTFFQDSTVFGGLAARWAGVPVRIACFRDMGFWSNRQQALLMRLACRQMTGYIANAQVVLEHFARLLGIDARKGRVIGNGVDVDQLPYVPHPGEARNIGIVGNMTREVKRTDLFIKAAGRVARDYPDIRWHIIGDGHLRPDMERLSEACGIGKQVHFTGRIDDVAGYLENLDIGVICSDSEGLSNAIIEYMFRGVATVATRVGGNPELIEDRVTGLLVPPDEDRALAEALLRMIEAPVERQAMAERARERIEANYNWCRCLERHESFYKEQLVLARGEISNAVY